MPTWLLVTLGAVVVIALVVLLVWAWRRAATSRPAPRREAWGETERKAAEQIVLDLATADPEDPAVQRLVRDAAHQALAADKALTHVEVVARDGTPLGRVARPEPTKDVYIADMLHEPHARSSRTPSPVERAAPPPVGRLGEPSPDVKSAPLADRLHLTDAIRQRVRDPNRAVDVLRAILEQAGQQVQVEGDLVVTEAVAIAVVDVRQDADRALTHGFLRIQETDAPRGIVLRLGYVDPTLIRRREASAPHVRHVGPDALQRMADAVAAGADPVVFAAGPATIR